MTTRFREVSLKSLLLEAEPSFYENANPVNQTVYDFMNGRKFKGRRLYSEYFPMELPVIDQGQYVMDGGFLVIEELTEAEYLAGVSA